MRGEKACAKRTIMAWLVFASRGPGKRGDMTPQELERLGIAITGSTAWIAPLAKLMGFRKTSAVRAWSTGKTKITAPKQRKLFLLAGQADAPLSPICDHTLSRLDRIMTLHDQGHSYASIGRQMGVTRQAVVGLVSNYRLVTPVAKAGTLQCPVCSVTFQPKYRKQLCCSKRCSIKRWQLLKRSTPVPPKPCQNCGAAFQPRDFRGKYCSRPCNNRARAKRHYWRRRLRARKAE
jgi:hypothetical protein